MVARFKHKNGNGLHIPKLAKSLPSKFEVDVALCERSLADYIRQAWHVVEPKKECIWNWHLDAISEHLQAVSLKSQKSF